LRLVNNSVIPINVETMDTATTSEIKIVPDVITARTITIPKGGLAKQTMPAGYASGLGSPVTVAPGKSFVFSVPQNHIAPSWYMRVPFQFKLPEPQIGVEPICYAEFFWEDLPERIRAGER